MNEAIELIVPRWYLLTILWFAVAGALLAFTQILGAGKKVENE